jgi:hypothetical protein
MQQRGCEMEISDWTAAYSFSSLMARVLCPWAR